jgi:hypothetical protein
MQGVLGKSVSKSTLARGLLRYPSMVDCFFHGIDQNYFYKLKTSMISQFNVDYTPNGIALNRGGRPSAIRITMVMTEAAIHTKADYGFVPTTPVEVSEENDGSDQADPAVTQASAAGKNDLGGDIQ